LATALGLVTAVALTMSIPLYADAVYYRVLREELSGAEGRTSRPPFAFLFHYMGASKGPVEWKDIQPLDAYLSGLAGSDLGLPQRGMARYFKTDTFGLFPQGDVAYADLDDPLTWVSFSFASSLEDHITILEGCFPAVADLAPESPIKVMVSEALALELGLQVGETYTAFANRELDEGRRTLQVPVRIVGVWRATDPQEEYWFYNPQALDDEMIVPEETFLGRIASYPDDEVYLGVWYLVMDGSDVHASDAVPLLARINAVQQTASSYLSGVDLFVSPEDALQNYQRAANLLTFLLYAFSVPIVGLILAFVGLVVGLAVGRQRNEIAVLRSRGATVIQVAGIAALEALLLGVVALVLGAPLGALIARVIGRTRSFLDFAVQPDLRVAVTGATLRLGAVAVGLAWVSQLLPTISAARHTIVTYKQERARSLRAPWWQRAWLDALLLIPAAYGVYLLNKQGSVALPGTDGSLTNDPFQNPLLFLVPALGIFSLTLFVLRILPLLMTVAAWIVSRTRGVGILLATRHLSRTPGFYAAPLMLLVLTLSLSAFTASLAETLDHHLYDQLYYQAGADMRLVESGEDTQAAARTAAAFGAAVNASEDAGPRWLFLPVSEHIKVAGVQAAARVGRYDATTQLSGGTQRGEFIGIDRIDFPHVAFWRRDFSPASLGTLMNALGATPNGVLVHYDFMYRHQLNVGDTFRIVVRTYGQPNPLDLQIVGGFDMFPTWYPNQEKYEPLFVGNLDYLFNRAGGQFPHEVWLMTDEGVDYEQIVEGVRDLRLHVIDWKAPLVKVAEEQQRPERQGLFGVLSVGFIAAAFLTVMGFLLYAFFSFRRRFIELGVLRAIGLSSGQMMAFLAWELIFLLLVGLIVGTGLGVWVSNLFIPYLQVGSGPSAQIPPFEVVIAWPAILRIYVLFGLLFVAALGGLTALLLRIKIFQAVKLGETA
jgi:putative ABC transport system permease protein